MRKSDQRAAPVQRENHVEDFAKRRVVARAQAQAGERLIRQPMPGSAKPRLDIFDDRCCLTRRAMREQPAGAFGDPGAHQQNGQRQRRADEEARAPAPVGGQQVRIEQHQRAGRAQRGAHPECAVDAEIGPAAYARRHEFLDRRVDGGVLAANAGTGEEAKQQEARQIPRQRRGRCGGEIERQGDKEQLAPAEPVSKPAEA